MSRTFLSPRMEAIEIERARLGDDPRAVAEKLGLPVDNVIGAFRVLDTIVAEPGEPRKPKKKPPMMGYPKDAA